MSENSERSREGLGFFTKISDERHFEKVKESLDKKGYFTDRVLHDRVSLKLSDLALIISPEGVISHIVHVRPARTGSTANRGFRSESPVQVDVSERELEAILSPAEWDVVRFGFERPSYRPPYDEWMSLWDAIKQLRSGLHEELRRLELLRFDSSFEFHDERVDSQRFHEKDALGVALDASRIPFHGVFAELSDGYDSGKSTLESLCGNTTEDVIINHDVRNFPGYVNEEDILHSCTLSQRGNKITIYNVNRRRAEAALGVDIIYHNLKYNSFTFIQYKMMNNEGNNRVPLWRFRPDSQFTNELMRMRRSKNAMTVSDRVVSPDQYRLVNEPFFFKFSRRQHLKVNAGTLASGSYVSLSHLDLCLDSLVGPQGGTVITKENMGRWITRTHFANLLADGWIGTNTVTPESLSLYVEQSLQAGNSILIAEGNGSIAIDSDETE